MNVIERIRELIKLEGLTRDELSKLTGIKYTRWQDVINNKTKIRHEEIESLGKAFPNYKLWIAYGDEIPDAGQISPMTKLAQNNYQGAGKA